MYVHGVFDAVDAGVISYLQLNFHFHFLIVVNNSTPYREVSSKCLVWLSLAYFVC